METFREALQAASQPGYLGDSQIVDGLLREFAAEVLTADHGSPMAFVAKADAEARKLAEIFLGRDKRYPGPRWNTAGNIDVHVGRREGIDSADPVERVAGGLLHFIHELAELGNSTAAENARPEQWQFQATAIVEDYTRLLLGLPPHAAA